MFKNLEDMQKVGKEQLDAFSAASNTFSNSLQQIATESSDYAKKSFEAASSATEKLVGAKSFESVVEVQTDFMKTSYEAFISQSKKMGDLYATLAKETFKPMEVAVAKAQAGKK